jgi:hypothetical protein
MEDRLDRAFEPRQKSSIAVNAAWHGQIPIRNFRSVQQRQPLIEEAVFILKPFRNDMLANAAGGWTTARKALSCCNTVL